MLGEFFKLIQKPELYQATWRDGGLYVAPAEPSSLSEPSKEVQQARHEKAADHGFWPSPIRVH